MTLHAGSRWSNPWPVACVCLALTVCLTPGCGDARRQADPALARGNTVVMAVESVADVLPNVLDLDFLVFERLAKRNERGELAGRLAESWQVSDDYTEWTVRLRTDVRWQDGTPFTARDVAFTFELLDDPDREYPGFETVVVDDATVRIRPPHAMPFLDDIVYYPRHLLQDLDPARFWSWRFWLEPVGNGPYRFVRYVPDTLMEFEANPDYSGPRPAIERVIVKFVGGAGLNELLAGTVDIVEGDLAQIPLIQADPRFRIHREVRPAARAIYWRTDHPLFEDPTVRRALTLAISRPELARLLRLPPEFPITDGPLTERQLYRGEYPQPLSYDPEESRRLLDAAGWTRPAAGAPRQRRGRQFRFTATVWRGNGMPELAVYVQEYLRRIGAEMEIEVLEEGAMWERHFNGDFEALFTIQQHGVEAHLRDFGRGNRTGYANAEAFELVDRMTATARPDEQDRLHLELAALFRQDLPVTRLLPWDWITFAHRRIRGLTSAAGSRVDFAGTYIDEMWVEETGSGDREGS